jgi:hypothetical protein
VIYALIGVAAVVAVLALALACAQRHGTATIRRRVVVCNLDNGQAIRGVLERVHNDVLVLSAAAMLGHEITDMAGRVLVPRHRVLWLQEPGQAALAAPGDDA